MKRRLLAAFVFLCASLPQLWAHTIITTPQWYQVFAISPNGKWACGIYSDYNSAERAFRWNIETDEIELLSAEESGAYDISDDGVVCGTFKDNKALANGAPVSMAGYYKDGDWHSLEMPEGNIVRGYSYGGITTDGHYMSGTVIFDNKDNGLYKSYIWDLQDGGKIVRQLNAQYNAITYCISPDGKSAAGWAYTRPGGNRNAVYWDENNNMKVLSTYESYACSSKRFSPDGKKLLFWGGWNEDESALTAIYDTETGRTSTIPKPQLGGADFYAISNNGTVVGGMDLQAGYGGLIIVNGKSMDIVDYLAEKGVSLDNVDIMKKSDGKPNIIWAIAISGDDSRIAIIYYDTEGQTRTMIVILEDNGAKAPESVTAEQMQGLNTVSLAWKESILADGVQGYNIYRGTEKLNSTPVTGTKYYDKVTAAGTYTYTVEAVYASATVKAEEVSVEVKAQTVSTPQTVSARQRGINGAYVQWMEPTTNYVNRTYVDMDNAVIDEFGAMIPTEFEVAIRFSQDDLANYAGYKVKKVQFYPMGKEASDWEINFYTYDAEGKLQRLKSQPITQELNYGTMNTVELDTPLDLPAGELLAAVHAYTNGGKVLGMDNGHYKTRYSDLVRTSKDADFYSMSEMSVQSANPYFCQWIMSVVLAPADASADGDKVDHYTIYDGSVKLGDTADLSYIADGLADGDHTLGVTATYANGTTSEAATATVAVETRRKGIDNVYLKANGNTAIDASWSAPADDDDTTISYASGEPAAQAPKGSSDLGYSFYASTVFTPSMLKSYDGYKLYAFRFYPLADAIFAFSLEKDDVPVTECEFDVQQCALGQWNTVYLPTALTLDGNANYRLIVEILDPPANEVPLAIDKNVPYDYYSNVYSEKGQSWYSISDYFSMDGNWMLGMKVAAPEGKALAVEGYDVYIDGAKKNDAALTDTKFSYDFGANDRANHNIRVDVRYPSATDAVEGTPFYFTIDGVLGIDDATVEQLRLRKGDNFLRVEGDGVESVSAYSISGVKAASAQGNTLNITNLAPGIYVVKAKAKAGELVRKIEIK